MPKHVLLRGALAIAAGLTLLLSPNCLRADHYEEANGTLEVIVYDFPDRRSEVRYLLHQAGVGAPIEFEFEDRGHPRELKSGDRIRIRGRRVGAILQVAAANQGGFSVTAAAAAASTGIQSTVVIMANLLDATHVGSAVQVSNLMFSASQASVDGMYRETSWNQISFAGVVVGPYLINYTTGQWNADTWANACDAAAAAAGVNLPAYSRKVYVFPDGSPVYGLGTIGGNPSRSWIGDWDGGDVYAHELGHNIGMHHSGTDQENNGTVNDEYADTSDIMGYGGVGLRGVNGPHKEQMGWLPPGKISVVTNGGTFTVSTLETDPALAAHPQLYKVAIPGTFETYYFSYRQPVGYDAILGGGYLNRLQIHRYSSGAAITRFISSLGDGESYTENAAGFTVTQVSHDATGATFDVSFTAAALPAPWRSTDIGGVAVGGSTRHASGVFTMQSSGGDIWGTSDAFHATVQPVSGDCTIVARVPSQENTAPWAKAGVMIRESLAANSAHAMMVITPGNGFAFQWRAATGGSSSHTAGGSLNAAPNNWVKLVRTGGTITGYKSADGTAWTVVGSATVTLGANAVACLAADSVAGDTLNTATFDSVAVTGQPLVTPGGLWRDVFHQVTSGNTVATLTNSPRYSRHPDFSAPITSAESTAGYNDNYGQRWTGWVIAPETGNYTFYLATDDEGELWLSPDRHPAGRVKIATKTGWTGSRQWSGAGVSGAIALTAGQRYFIEVLHKEGGGGDNCAVAWRKPGDAAAPADGTDPIPGTQLEYLPGGVFDPYVYPAILVQPVSLTVDAGGPATLSVSAAGLGSLGYQWYKNGVLLGGATSAALTIPAVAESDQASYTCVVTSVHGSATSAAGVMAVNQAPVAAGGAATTGAGIPVAVTLTGSDADGNSLTFAVVTAPANGALSGAAPNLTYTPGASFTGADSFTFRVNDGRLDSPVATFSLTVTNTAPPPALPAGWTGQDIGAVGIAGSATGSGGVFSLSGSGTGFGGTSDQFQFASTALSGDGEIRVRISGMANAGSTARAGVMIRESTATGSRFAFCGRRGDGTMQFLRRTTTGGTVASNNKASNATPVWVRLVRTGNSITAYKSTNGTSWTQVGQAATVTMASQISIGLCVSSGVNTSASSATFDNVTVTP